LDERIWVLESECHVEQYLRRRNAPRPTLRLAHVDAHLLIARAAKALVFGAFADRSTDVGRTVAPPREAVDLVIRRIEIRGAKNAMS